MSSILKVNTLTGVSTAGSIAVTGEGNSTTTNLQQGLAKATGNVNQTSTQAILTSFNVSTLTDVAVSESKLTFTNNMGDADFSYAFGTRENNSANGEQYLTTKSANANTTSTVSAHSAGFNATLEDVASASMTVFGDLA
tara:strand:+ start:760 stop:1176 length:417 start_codon:yes stop_codon:yes gene_type:complete